MKNSNRLTEVLFWMIIIATAIFYLTKGNDMYHKKYERLDKNNSKTLK